MSRRLTRRAVPSLVLIALVAGRLPYASAAVRPPEPSTPIAGSISSITAAREEIARPSTTAKLGAGGSLSDVVAISPTDIWAVGQQGVNDEWRNRGVITRWQAGTWTEVGVRGDASGTGPLRSMSGPSAGELWVVGDGHDGVPYIGRGGASGFDRVVAPGLRGGDWLRAVAAQNGKVVTVGGRGKSALIVTGANKWNIIQGPAGGLYGVGLSGKDGWAVGDTGSRPLVMRRVGGQWKEWPVPWIRGGYLRDVYVQSGKKAIAVGGVFRGDEPGQPLIMRWDGKKWTRDAVPAAVASAQLYAVTGDGKGGFWASGYDSARPEEAFLLRYADGKWKPMRGEPARQPGRTARLQGVTRAGDLTMAVGNVLDDEHGDADLVETFGPAAG